MNHRLATLDDVPLLAGMNRQLTEDEQHRNRFRDRQWFEQRMRSFLVTDYNAVLFEQNSQPVAYALYRADGDDSIYLRQIFVTRNCRRQGIGRQAISILRSHYWPPDKRISLSVLVTNPAAIADWATTTLGARRLEICADYRNRASCRVAEKTGFTLEAIQHSVQRGVNGELCDMCMYVRLANTG